MITQNHRIIGLAGGIASGKSCVRKMFEQLGVPCIDIDILSRSIHQNPQHPACAELQQRFPQQMTEQGRLQRASLRHYFSRFPEANLSLKSILKPYVMQALLAWTSQQSSVYVVWESALLIEEKLLEDAMAHQHRTLWVKTTAENQMKRLGMRYPDWSLEELNRVVALQYTIDQAQHLIDDIIENNADFDSLKSQVDQLHQNYLKWGAST